MRQESICCVYLKTPFYDFDNKVQLSIILELNASFKFCFKL